MTRPRRELLFASVVMSAVLLMPAATEASGTISTEFAETDYVLFAVFALLGPSFFYTVQKTRKED